VDHTWPLVASALVGVAVGAREAEVQSWVAGVVSLWWVVLAVRLRRRVPSTPLLIQLLLRPVAALVWSCVPGWGWDVRWGPCVIWCALLLSRRDGIDARVAPTVQAVPDTIPPPPPTPTKRLLPMRWTVLRNDVNDAMVPIYKYLCAVCEEEAEFTAVGDSDEAESATPPVTGKEEVRRQLEEIATQLHCIETYNFCIRSIEYQQYVLKAQQRRASSAEPLWRKAYEAYHLVCQQHLTHNASMPINVRPVVRVRAARAMNSFDRYMQLTEVERLHVLRDAEMECLMMLNDRFLREVETLFEAYTEYKL